ncbi:MAG: UvrD-helicase domain-containing protein [Fimbriimonadaceae bacterium]|nr:UvrD-helicase domain-containing protein [Fimbriimonadaceae bacterium]
MPLDLESLNPAQREAVEWPGGPMLVFAGAGSGKTRVITTRIARLIEDGVWPSRILAVTFTNKAAKEMRERVANLAEADVKNMWIGTFHAVCGRMLRMDGQAIGIDRNFVVYDDADQLSLVRDILKRKNVDDKSVQPRALLSEISSAKEKLQSPEKYAERAAGFFERICADVYKQYQAGLRRANALDFDDLLGMAVRLLREREDVRTKYQERFQHLLVDEYQDVNLAQYELVRAVGDGSRNIMVVGDDDQSIYAWRGADVELILRFGSDYPDAKVIKLERNYRSTQIILDAAYEVIKNNRARADKRLWTDRKGGASITLSEAGTEQDEAMMVADAIQRLVNAGVRRWGDFAVLYRMNAQSRVLEEAFLMLRIPHVLVGGVRFYERKEVKDMMSYLRLAWNPLDDASFRRIVNVPTRGLGATSLAEIGAYAAAKGLSLFQAAATQEVQASLARKAASSLRAFVSVLEEATHLAQEGRVTPVLMKLMNDSGYLESVRTDASREGVDRLGNLQELQNVTAQYDETADEPTLGEFLENVALVADVDTLTSAGEGVTLMTLHSAKGLEFPVVYLVGLEEGLFPHSRSLNSDSGIEEERRLCYVGMTRAKEELHLFHAHRRALFGQPTFNPRSRFLDEIPDALLASPKLYRRDHQLRSEPGRRVESGMAPPDGGGASFRRDAPRSVPWNAPFEVGTRVRHAKFGVGVVVACSPLRDDAEVTVAFPGAMGVKKLVQSLAKLVPE